MFLSETNVDCADHSSPCEVVWTFDSALCLWAVLRFSQEPLAEGPPFLTITWSESAQIESWISNGGGIAVQGLGDAAILTPETVLTYFMERLAGLSWSLATQYIQVLSSIVSE